MINPARRPRDGVTGMVAGRTNRRRKPQISVVDQTSCVVDDLRLGRIGRHLRQRLGWRQRDLGDRIGLSQGEISLFERGRIDGMPVATVRRILGGVEAELVLYVRWRGGDLDRLLDAGHARLCNDLAGLLIDQGWKVAPEVSYSVYGERGSIDLLAWEPTTMTLLVTEVKTEVASVEATFRKHDEKVRLGPLVAQERFGWAANVTARLLVFPEHRTVRRQVEDKAALFGRVYPTRNVGVRRWLRSPDGPMSGLIFLPDTSQPRGRRGRPSPKRVRVGSPRTDEVD
jgi:transcriptional regulator with XRE-family HTH domain